MSQIFSVLFVTFFKNFTPTQAIEKTSQSMGFDFKRVEDALNGGGTPLTTLVSSSS